MRLDDGIKGICYRNQTTSGPSSRLVKVFARRYGSYAEEKIANKGWFVGQPQGLQDSSTFAGQRGSACMRCRILISGVMYPLVTSLLRLRSGSTTAMIPSKWVVVQMDMRSVSPNRRSKAGEYREEKKEDICTVIALQVMYDGFLEHSGRGVEDNRKNTTSNVDFCHVTSDTSYYRRPFISLPSFRFYSAHFWAFHALFKECLSIVFTQRRSFHGHFIIPSSST